VHIPHIAVQAGNDVAISRAMMRCRCCDVIAITFAPLLHAAAAAAVAVICEMTVSVSDARPGTPHRSARSTTVISCHPTRARQASERATPANSMIDLNTTKYCSNTRRPPAAIAAVNNNSRPQRRLRLSPSCLRRLCDSSGKQPPPNMYDGVTSSCLGSIQLLQARMDTDGI